MFPIGSAYFYQELIKVSKESDVRVLERSLGGVAFVSPRGKIGLEGCL